MKIKQQGFALIESMIAVVVFAILLIALLNYTQYITLNFNQIYQSSTAIRMLQSALERKASFIEITSVNTEQLYPNWQVAETLSSKGDKCTESIMALIIDTQQFSLNRWFCIVADWIQ
nr:prepilin-type N-terminal cleavage/methylation domain-containing protein [Providencia sp.]